MTTAAATQPVTLQCMEVWGGNQAVDNGVVMPGLDAWVFSRPYGDHSAGGDVHYLSSCATGRITRLMIADVSGHGEPVAKVGTTLRGLMRRFINHLDQRKAVGFLNREFSALAKDGCFATAVMGTYWAPTSDLALCNAGHPRPLWYSAKSKRWAVLEGKSSGGDDDEGPTDVPLGIIDSTTYSEIRLRLRPGDLVLLYTDSLLEVKKPDGRLLGEAGLIELLNSVDASDPATFISRAFEKVSALSGLPDDDATMLLLRTNGVVPDLTLGERLATIGRVLRGLLPGRDHSGLPELSKANTGGFFFKKLNLKWGSRSK